MIETVHIDGAPATVEDLSAALVSNYAAFTTFQHEPGGVRGLDLHLSRLASSSLELFGQSVPDARLREFIRTALAGRDERLSVRVQLFLPTITPRRVDAKGRPSVLVRVSGPLPELRGPLRLQSQAYQREVPHLKHAATFGLIRAARQARTASFDDALFVASDGLISEGSIWNIGFIEGQSVIWPRAPMLAGTGQALIERGLMAVGLNSETRPVRLDEVGRFDGAFICNSSTAAAPVSTIDQTRLNTDPRVIEWLKAAWAANPVEAI
ncbi:MAG: aminotransferase class IV [Caulobacterales bacterium]|nr:aminotransferase class IV [Caulobacterales bacterium]